MDPDSMNPENRIPENMIPENIVPENIARTGIEKLAGKVVEILSVILFAAITVSGAVCSAWLTNGYTRDFVFQRDSVLLNLLIFAVLFTVWKVTADFVAKRGEKGRRTLLVIVLVYVFVVSLGWAAVSKCFPTADQASVYYGAKHFAADNFEDIAYMASYFSCYPHQMGLAFFYELLLRIFHTESFHLLQGINACCNVLTVWALYDITKRSFRNRKAGIYLLLLAALCLPLLWYTPFVYGELPSFAFSFLGVQKLLAARDHAADGKEKQAVLSGIFSLAALFAATLVRKNTLILIAAVGITGVVALLSGCGVDREQKTKRRKRRLQLGVYLAVLLLLCSQAGNLAIRMYEARSGRVLNDGVPGKTYLVMGLMENEYAPGWYTGYNFETYAYAAEYDQKKAIAIAQEDLEKRWQELLKEPAYTARFFGKKFLAEWLNTGYACYDYTAGKYYDRLPVVESLYSGILFYVTRFFMDKYQFAVYLTALVGMAVCLGKGRQQFQKGGIFWYIFAATILGGALFYLAWEGNGRYILPYFLMTLPYAAGGLAWIDRCFQNMYNKQHLKRQEKMGGSQ